MPPVLALIGKPDCGKTTLIEKLIPALAARGIRTGTIKHHHGDIEMDTPGKDTWRHKQAGARAVLLASPGGIGLVRDTDEEIPAAELASQYFPDVDLVIAEGYRQSLFPKIEVFRSALYEDPLPDPGETLIAMVSDVAIRPELTRFLPEDVDGLTEFIIEKIIKP